MSDTDVTIAAFKRYLQGVRSQATAVKYGSYAANFLVLMESNGYRNFSQIPPGLLGDFASMLSNQGKNPSTVRVQVFAAKKYLDWVASRGVQVAHQNKPELPKKIHRIRESLPQAQFNLYFQQADMDLEEPLRTAVMLLPCAGLRAQEMVGLRLASLKPVQVTLKNGKKKTTIALIVFGKGDKERIVPLMEEGVEILTGYLAGWRRKHKGPWLFPHVATHGKLVHASGKKHISDRTLRLALQKLREPLGMEFTPHTMRRTYLTMLYRKGLDLRALANIAGHSSVQTTIDHYIVMEPDDNVRAVHNVGGSMTE